MSDTKTKELNDAIKGDLLDLATQISIKARWVHELPLRAISDTRHWSVTSQMPRVNDWLSGKTDMDLVDRLRRKMERFVDDLVHLLDSLFEHKHTAKLERGHFGDGVSVRVWTKKSNVPAPVAIEDLITAHITGMVDRVYP